jgi:hypothetical protein
VKAGAGAIAPAAGTEVVVCALPVVIGALPVVIGALAVVVGVRATVVAAALGDDGFESSPRATTSATTPAAITRPPPNVSQNPLARL